MFNRTKISRQPKSSRPALSRGKNLRRWLKMETLEDRRLLAAIPVLNSLPGADASLYLDFDGHFEASWGAYSNVTSPAYDIDGNPSDFNSVELTFIQELWQVVAEDYAPFNINVTTVEPAVLAAGVSPEQANGVALRVAVGGSFDVLGRGGGTGGYAYINSFTDAIPNVAFVFPVSLSGSQSDSLGAGNIASHEAGHAFGLEHYTNAVDLDAGFQSLMNNGNYGIEDTTWSSGVNSLGNLQDDMAHIARPINAFGYRADDHGNATGNATLLAGSGTTFTASGVIETSTDVDVFAITTAQTESLQISVNGDPFAQNLDVVVDLLDASGNILATASPDDSKNAVLFGEVSGSKYLAVRGTGDYGRVGQYSVSVTASTPGITVTRPTFSPTTDELGRSETVTIALNSKPTSNVAFDVASSDTSEGVVSPNQLVFTPSNWFVPQTITISGVADDSIDGDHGYDIAVLAAVSTDPDYDGVFDPADLRVVNLDAHAGKLFWVRYEDSPSFNGFVEGISGSTQQSETIVDSEAAFGVAPSKQYPRNIEVNAESGKIYWTDYGADAIRRSNLDGSSAETVVSGLANPTGLAIDATGGKIYWSDSTSDKIQRANLDGSGVEDLITTGLIGPGELKLDTVNGKMYWRDIGSTSDSSTFTVSRANLDGSQVEVVLASDGENRPYALELDVDAGKMYVGMRDLDGLSRIARADLSGANRETLVDVSALNVPVYSSVTPTQIQGIALDPGSNRLYWSVQNRIFSASSLDGSDIALVAEYVDNVRGIDFIEQVPVAPERVEIFADSFQSGQWNGNWVEDSQNDWFTSSQRATDGSASAEVDGRATNATLSLANAIDLSGYESAELTFDWYIESSFDSGEYLSMDVSSNGGASWQTDVRRLRGNVDAENTWHSETVDLTSFASSDLKLRFRASVSGSDEDANVDNVKIVGINIGNHPPAVDAGVDQIISDADATGSELVTLVGTASNSDGTIVSVQWTEGANVLGNSTTLTTSLTVGVHTLTLTAFDDQGASTSDTVVVNVLANQGPTANAGADQTVSDNDSNGSEAVTLVGSGNDADGTIVSYQWTEGSTVLGDTASIVSTLSVGTHTLTLTVTDNGGATASDTVVVTVAQASSEVVLFEDSFEVGSNNNDWNGKWIEDSQNDFFRSTQRATAGNRSAEVDGYAGNATLTMSSAVDVSTYATATLTFDWLIESGFDRGEYLALDISINGGASWIQDVRRLSGNQSAENTWHSETVDLSTYASSNLLIRFRTLVSGSAEDANIDDVRIIASGSSAAMMAPNAFAVDNFFADDDEEEAYWLF